MTPAAGAGTACVAGALAAFFEQRACGAYGGMGGGNGVLYSAFKRSSLRFLLARDETSAMYQAIEASIRTGKVAVVIFTTGEAIRRGLSAVPTAHAEGARVVILYGASDPSSFRRAAIQPTDHDTLPADFFRAGPHIALGAFVTDPAELPLLLTRITTGIQRPQGFVAALALTGVVQSAPPPELKELRLAVSLPAPAPAAIDYCVDVLREDFAVLAGFGARAAFRKVRELVRRTRAPAFTTPRAKGVLEGPSIGLGGIDDYYAGRARPERLLVLGSKLGLGSCRWDADLLPRRELIHVDVDPSCFGTSFIGFPTYGVVSDVELFLEAVLARIP